VTPGPLPALALAISVSLAAAGCHGRGGRATQRPAPTVNVVGHRWWWEIRYPDPQAQGVVVTANELHLPVGRSVKVVLESSDFIHGFWVPGLHAKTDVIPGNRTETTLRADHPGVYRGRCAEFCGPPHARMALVVVAEDDASFEAWLEAQRAPAPEPPSAEARRGRDVFVRSCAQCHSVRGAFAGATAGPDLTHVASRRAFGAPTVARTQVHLQAWATSPQPAPARASLPARGTAPGDDLRALVAYLETLR
jgi:cytochrome c oxidase subunit 2